MGRRGLSIAIAKLKKEIEVCENYKNRILNHVQKTKSKCVNKKITYYEYEKFINKKLDGKTIQEWIKHYDSHIKKCEKNIKREIRKFRTKKVLPKIFISAVLISLLIIAIFYITPVIIGFVTQEQIKTHTQNLNLEFTESQDYELELENLGQLDSMQISGLIEGQGQVKVYLDDLLILDSSNIQSKKAKITGGIITEIKQDKTTIELILGLFQKTFLIITGRVVEENEESEKPVEQPEEEPTEEITESPTLSIPEETSEEEVIEEELVKQPEVVEEEPIEKEPSQNIIEELEEEITEEPTEELTNETSSEQPTIDPDKPKETKKPTKDTEERVTEGAEPLAEEQEIVIKQFKNLCEETCKLKNLNLNKSSYILKIEISNAKLNLEEIKYKIISKIKEEKITEEEIPEENQTQEPIENRTGMNITIPEADWNKTIIPEEPTETNITIPKENITETNITIPETNLTEIPIINETTNLTEINQTLINKTIINLTELSITTNQYKAIINRPVKWIKTLKVNKTGTQETNLNLELPKQAKNISVKTDEEVQQALNELEGYEELIKKTNKGNLAGTGITGYVSLDIRNSKGILTRLFRWLMSLSITGNVIQESEIQDNIVETSENRVIELNEIANQTTDGEIGVEYYTQAPVSEETELPNGKRITITGPDEVHYKKILAYTLLDNTLSMNEVNKIKLYQIKTVEQESITEEPVEQLKEEPEKIKNTNKTIPETNQTTPKTSPITAFAISSSNQSNQINNQDNSSSFQDNKNSPPNIKNSKHTDITQTIKQKTNFTAYDLDEDGFIDYVEWEVPNLSEQIYEIIYITKAEHLDENYNLISDIYEQVNAKDDIWSEQIPNNHYVRVTFEKELDKTKDITIFARASNNQPECYDNETEILTDEGWKLFKDLDENERVMTLNAETGEKEWQIPMEYQEFDYDKEMYNIGLEDGSELVVSEKHKVYVNKDNYTFNLSLKSSVLNTLIEDCFLNPGSLDQIPQSNFNASANIGTSLSWISCLASGSNDLESLSGMINSIFFNSSNIKSICSNEILEYFEIEDLIFNNSLQQCSGEYNFSPRNSELIIMNLTGLSLKKDINILVSTTNSIYQPSFFNFSQAFCFTLSPNLRQSSSVSSEFSNILSNFLSNNALLTFSDKNCLIASEKFNSGNSSNLAFNSLGIDRVMFGIFKPPVYSVEDVEVYKSFDLRQISEVYSDIENGKDVWFLDEDNNPVKVKSIKKKDYDGKIYDVDVENDIILVKKKNNTPIWSGNSNPNNQSISYEAEIEVYEKNTNTLITKFTNITSENWYKIYLTNLSENQTQDTFDLKIKCNNLITNNPNQNTNNPDTTKNQKQTKDNDSYLKISEDIDIKTNNINNCGLEFDYIVDPTITINEEEVIIDSLLTNVTAG